MKLKNMLKSSPRVPQFHLKLEWKVFKFLVSGVILFASEDVIKQMTVRWDPVSLTYTYNATPETLRVKHYTWTTTRRESLKSMAHECTTCQLILHTHETFSFKSITFDDIKYWDMLLLQKDLRQRGALFHIRFRCLLLYFLKETWMTEAVDKELSKYSGVQLVIFKVKLHEGNGHGAMYIYLL